MIRLLVSLLFLSSAAIADEQPIEGAFGLELGGKLETRLIEKCNVMEGLDYCKVDPDSKIAFFTDYIVTLEPTESRIMYIEAQGHYQESCEDSKAQLAQVLDKGWSNFKGEAYLWGNGETIGKLECQETDEGYVLALKLVDSKLKVATDKRVASDSKG